jgi:hypothetical protein
VVGVNPKENSGEPPTTRRIVGAKPLKNPLLPQKALLPPRHQPVIMRPDQDKRKSNTKAVGTTKSVRHKKPNASG